MKCKLSIFLIISILFTLLQVNSFALNILTETDISGQDSIWSINGPYLQGMKTNGSRSWAPGFIGQSVKKWRFEIGNGGQTVWLVLSGDTNKYVSLGWAGGRQDDFGKIVDFTANGYAIRTNIAASFSGSKPVEGDTVEMQYDDTTGTYTFHIKRIGDSDFSLYGTLRKSDYPAVTNWDGETGNMGMGVCTELTYYYNILKNVQIENGTGDSQEIDNVWNTKVWNSAGDSITEPGKYQNIVNSTLNFNTVRNYGTGGARITYADGYPVSPICKSYENMDDNADIVTVFAGTNDFSGNVPLGSINDTTDTTFYGALKIIAEGLIKKYPNRKIAFFTPIKRTYYPGDFYAGDVPNEIGLKLIYYVNAIKEVCGMYNIPVLDLYNESGITVDNAATYLGDGLHPNDAGHLLIANAIINFFNNVLIQIPAMNSSNPIATNTPNPTSTLIPSNTPLPTSTNTPTQADTSSPIDQPISNTPASSILTSTNTPDAISTPTPIPSESTTPVPSITPPASPKSKTEISVMVNDTKLSFDVQPYIDSNSRTMIPVRSISEVLGAKVEWNGKKQEVTIVKDKKVLKIIINSDKLFIDNHVLTMDTKAVIRNNRTFIPIRYIAEALGLKVKWDSSSKTVSINMD